jgi:hypothetical protein
VTPRMSLGGRSSGLGGSDYENCSYSNTSKVGYEGFRIPLEQIC